MIKILLILYSFLFFKGMMIPPFAYMTDTTSQTYPPMTSNTTPAPYVASASNQYSASYYPFEALDYTNLGEPDRWSTGSNVTNAWMQLYFGRKIIIKSYAVVAATNPQQLAALRTWTFSASNDGTNFTVLDTQTGVPAWTPGESRRYQLTNTTAYSYYRIHGTAVSGGTNMTIGMLHLFRSRY